MKRNSLKDIKLQLCPEKTSSQTHQKCSIAIEKFLKGCVNMFLQVSIVVYKISRKLKKNAGRGQFWKLPI
jgi:hypothetical protein